MLHKQNPSVGQLLEIGPDGTIVLIVNMYPSMWLPNAMICLVLESSGSVREINVFPNDVWKPLT